MNRSSIFCLALLLLNSALLGQQEQPAANGSQTGRQWREEGNRLWDEYMGIYREKGEEEAGAVLTERATGFRKRLGEHIRTKMPLRLDPDLVGASDISFGLSLRSEWGNIESAFDGWRWWSDVYGSVPSDRYQQPESVMRDFTRAFLIRWDENDAVKALSYLKEFDARFIKAPREISDQWSATKSASLTHISRKLIEERNIVGLKSLEQEMWTFWNNDGSSFESRTAALSEFARTLYSSGNPERAALLLRQWEAHHKGKSLDARFYNVQFYVNLFGIGDLTTARTAAFELGRRQTTPSLSTQDPTFGVLDAYYANIGLPEQELRRRAAIDTERKREKYEASKTDK